MNKAERLEKGSNTGWRVTVRPDGNGDVTVVLAATEDCDARSAMHGGRPDVVQPDGVDRQRSVAET